MANGQGITFSNIRIKTSHNDIVPDTYKTIHREVYWAHYVDWGLTTPLLLLDLFFLAGVSGANILVGVGADLVMIVTSLLASLTGREKVAWGYYAMSCIAYLVVVYQLAYNCRNAVRGRDSKAVNFFTAISGYTIIVWAVYLMYAA
jgi:bacteriorhodopsin